ncbi:hypothetical protein [uncultured Dysosmobacter sp.]|uniref:hypothetical protein n=1 Tax=uncultured Dysosmobacter sp. TaxID=2591384 RepID=UPI00261E2EC2|nr:hypothetical protein [uncultured Dysosmobacter sp.]
MMNFSKIFKENEQVTIPAEAFMQLVYETAMYGILERAYEAGDKEEFSRTAEIVFDPYACRKRFFSGPAEVAE